MDAERVAPPWLPYQSRHALSLASTHGAVGLAERQDGPARRPARAQRLSADGGRRASARTSTGADTGTLRGSRGRGRIETKMNAAVMQVLAKRPFAHPSARV